MEYATNENKRDFDPNSSARCGAGAGATNRAQPAAQIIAGNEDTLFIKSDGAHDPANRPRWFRGDAVLPPPVTARWRAGCYQNLAAGHSAVFTGKPQPLAAREMPSTQGDLRLVMWMVSVLMCESHL
jgi:hypothetical protein